MLRTRVRFPELTRRTQLLLGVVLVVIALAMVRLVLGSSSHGASVAQRSSPVHGGLALATCSNRTTSRAVDVTSKCPRRPRHANVRRHKVTSPAAKVLRQPLKRHSILSPPRSPLADYTGQLLPVLQRARTTFAVGAQQARAVDGYDQLDSVCGWYANRVTVLTAQVDGVPHPSPWYTDVGYLHHSLLGVYHDMSGALQACQIAAENGDDAGVATARHDLSATSQRMNSMVAYVRWLAKRP